ncbi:hypothetical protein ACLOJK_006772 [Asimina triloba]
MRGSNDLNVALGLEKLPMTRVSLSTSSEEAKLESIPKRARYVAARLERRAKEKEETTYLK